MSETLKWARDILDHSWDDDHDPIPRLARAIIMDADRLNVADTSPASQEGDADDVLDALIGVSGRDLQHPNGPCWCPEGRGGADHTVACERARAMFPHLVASQEREPGWYRRLSGESAKWGGPNPPHLIDDDPELNGEPHEPDCPQATPYEVGSGEPWECTCGGEGAPEQDGEPVRWEDCERCVGTGEVAPEGYPCSYCEGGRIAYWFAVDDESVVAHLHVYGAPDLPERHCHVESLDDSERAAAERLPLGVHALRLGIVVEGMTGDFAHEMAAAVEYNIVLQEQIDRLPPEREAEAREPDGWAETDAPDLNRQGDRWHSRKGRSSLYTVPVYFGTPGPDREAEAAKWLECEYCGGQISTDGVDHERGCLLRHIHNLDDLFKAARHGSGFDREAEDGPEALEAAVSLMADREAEIRADAERKARRALLDELVRLSRDPKLSMPEVVARLSPTDEQESPNRSDEL